MIKCNTIFISTGGGERKRERDRKREVVCGKRKRERDWKNGKMSVSPN